MDRSLFIRLALIVVTSAVYWQATGFGFVDFDDPEYVRDRIEVQNGLTLAGFRWALTTGAVANWHPLTWLSLMLDTELYNHDPRGYHVTNLTLHGLNVLLLLGLLQSMTGAFWRSAFVAAMLAVHPLHVESVAWIAERKDVLSMTFWLLTIAMYVRFVRQGGALRYLATLSLFALGLMAKPMVVTLPFVLLLLDYWPLKRFAILDVAIQNPKSKIQNPKSKILLLEKLPFLILAAAASVITMIVQRGSGQLDYGIWVPLRIRIANALVAYVRYVGKLFWPVDLAVLYPNPSILGQSFWSTFQVIGAALILIAITVFVCVLSRKRPYFVVGWFWFVGTLVPVIGLVQAGPQSLADRYTYIPFIGLYIIMAWGVTDLAMRLKRREIVLGSLSAAAIAVCGALTWRQVQHWRDSFALFGHTLAITKDNWLIHSNLGVIEGKAGKLPSATRHFEEAIRINRDSGWLYEQLGSAYSSTDPYKAQLEYEKAITLDPNLAKAHSNLGVVLTQRGRAEEAIPHFQKAAELLPMDAEAHRALAVALSGVGRHDEALKAIQEAMRFQPKAPAYIEVMRIIQSQLQSPRPSPSGPTSQPQD